MSYVGRMTTTEPTTTTDPVVPDWTLADRLHRARRHAGMEQGELAGAIGIARSSLSSYENGHRVPRRPVILSWAMATGVDVGWLASGSPRTDVLLRSGQISLDDLLSGGRALAA